MSAAAQQTQTSKVKTPKNPSVPRKPADHPSYNDMIKAAIGALKDQKGASKQAIVKYVAANYKVGADCNRHVKQQLVRMVKNNVLTQPKGNGANGRFKINKALEEAQAKKAAAAAKKKAASAKKTEAKPKKLSSQTKKTGVKKPAAKKPAVKKSPKKQKAKKSVVVKKPAVKKSVAKKPGVKKQTKKPAVKKAAKK